MKILLFPLCVGPGNHHCFFHTDFFPGDFFPGRRFFYRGLGGKLRGTKFFASRLVRKNDLFFTHILRISTIFCRFSGFITHV